MWSGSGAGGGGLAVRQSSPDATNPSKKTIPDPMKILNSATFKAWSLELI
jgi:hypothetical protein